MIKKAKKSVAVGLSVALAVTSVNIPVNSASAAAKKAKLSATKKTLTAGKSTTLTLKTNKKKAKTIKSINAKYVKVSTSKKSVATVKKVSKKSKFTGVKVTAKKAGKSTITVKVTKGTYKGTYKCTVTVKKKASATKAPTQKPTEAPTATPEVTVEPTQVPTQEPTAEPATSPSITAEPTIKAAKVEGKVTNSIADYENTVLANQTANVRFKVTDASGNALKNETVTITLETDDAPNAGYSYGLDGENKKVAVVTTDAEGYAKVVLAPKDDYSAAPEKAVASYKLTASCNSDETVKSSVKVSIGAIVYQIKDTGFSVQDITADGNKKVATNAGTTVRTQNTHDLAGRSVNYVSTQQVSATGEDHSAKFNTEVGISLPGTKDVDTTASKYVQGISFNSGKYHTYADTNKDIDFKIKDMNSVAYATLYFDNITASKYTKITVSAYKTVNGNKVLNKLQEWSDYKTNGQGLQIGNDILKTYEGVRININSAGQVNTKQNDGFNVKDLTYVYDTAKATTRVVKTLSSAKVTWEAANPVYSTEAEFTDSMITGSILKADETATYSVPVFPYVGNGIITVYNKNKEVVRYYAVPTENRQTGTDSITGKPVYANVNTIVSTATPYLISQDEAKTINPGTIKQDGNVVTVDSTKSGTQFLKGTITSDDKNLVLDAKNSEVYTSVMWNPVENKAVTSDVNTFYALEGQKVDVIAQLVDKNGNKETINGVGIEFSDKNGAVAKDEKQYGNNYGDKATAALNKSTYYATKGYNGYATVTDITNPNASGVGQTDKNGQVKLTLEGTDAVDLIGLTAKSTDSRYNVVLTIGNTTVTEAELYWARVSIKYHDKIGTGDTWASTSDNNGLTTVATTNYDVNDAWEVGTFVDLTVPNITGKYAPIVAANQYGFSLAATSGIKIGVKAGEESEGTVAPSSTVNGMAEVSTTKGGEGEIINTIDKNSVSSDVTFKLMWANEIKGVGYGNTSADEKMTINYKFGSDTIQTTSIDAMGTYGVVGETKLAFVKVSSLFGDIAKADRTVEFTIPSNVNAVFDENTALAFRGSSDYEMKEVAGKGTLGTDAKVVTVKTDANGIAVVAIKATDAANVKLTASLLKDTTAGEYDSTGAKCDATYTFRNVDTLVPDLGTYKDGSYKITYTDNSITLVFNEEILATSAVKDIFKVEYAADGTTYDPYTNSIKDVKVDGKKVTISYATDVFRGHSDKSKVKVTIAPKVADTDISGLVKGVQYTLTSKTGSTLEDVIEFSYGAAATSKKAADIADDVAATAIVAKFKTATFENYETGAKAAYEAAGATVTSKVDAKLAAASLATKAQFDSEYTTLKTASTDLTATNYTTKTKIADIETALQTDLTGYSDVDVTVEGVKGTATVDYDAANLKTGNVVTITVKVKTAKTNMSLVKKVTIA